jgi:hypothetical protein
VHTASLRFKTMGKFLRRHFGRMRRIRQARARNALQDSWPHYAPELVELEQIRREDAAWTPTTRKPRGAAVGESSDDSDAEEDEPLAPFDLYAALGVRKGPKGVSGGRSRCFAQFHSRSAKLDPESFRDAVDYDQEAWLQYRRVALAFVVLSDDARREVYDSAGFEGLVKSESYSEISVFDLDAVGIFDDFFEAVNPLTGEEDPEIKEYLLLSAADDDDEDDDIVLPVAVDGSSKRREDPGAFPRPPPQAAAASLALSDTVMRSRRPQYPGADAWARLKR